MISVDDIIEYLIIGMVTGGFITVAPAVIGFAIDTISKIFKS